MKYLTILFFCFVVLACKSQKYSLEENSELTLKNGFYLITPSGIAEGNTTVSASFTLEDYNKDKILIYGFYFRNDFIELKENQKNNTFKGSVILQKNKDATIPFQLKNSEIVIAYSKNNKEKFVKFKLKRKERDNFDVLMQNKN